MMSLVLLGDFIGYYLALLYGVEPTQVHAVAEFKAALADTIPYLEEFKGSELLMTDSSPLQRKLHNWQMLLLDLTRANRLLYFKSERGQLGADHFAGVR